MKRNIPPDELPILSNGNQLEYRFPFAVDVWMTPVMYLDYEMHARHDDVSSMIMKQAVARLVPYRPKVLVMGFNTQAADYFTACNVDVYERNTSFSADPSGDIRVLYDAIPHYDIIRYHGTLTTDMMQRAHDHKTLIMPRMVVWDAPMGCWRARGMYGESLGVYDRSLHSPTSVFIDMDSDTPYARSWIGGSRSRKLVQCDIKQTFMMWGD